MSPTGLSRQQCEDSRTNEKFILHEKSKHASPTHHLRMHPLSTLDLPYLPPAEPSKGI